MQALIIGYGVSGRSAACLLNEKGWKVTAIDRNAHNMQADEGICLLNESESLDLSDYQLAILSPGIALTHPLVRKLQDANIEIIGEVELAFRFLTHPILAITGTNGKTTVTLLVAHVLNCSGRKARALGNVGTPLAAQVGHLASGEIIVAELSSYQLETLQKPLIDAGAILNITPDHLDRYGTMEAYAKAKIRLKDCLKSKGKLFVENNTYYSYQELFHNFPCDLYGDEGAFSTDFDAVYKNGQSICSLPNKLRGKASHDVENFLAAFALCDFQGVSADDFLRAYSTFKKPQHRIEFVRTVSGVHFYDDSKGTNIDAVMRAVESMPSCTLLIAGGVDKGAAYVPWIAAFDDKVKAIFAIGEASSKIYQEINAHIPVYLCASLQQAVQQAYALAQAGDNVLLSPGCSSFDMFRDYADRGQQFQKHVQQLNAK